MGIRCFWDGKKGFAGLYCDGRWRIVLLYYTIVGGPYTGRGRVLLLLLAASAMKSKEGTIDLLFPLVRYEYNVAFLLPPPITFCFFPRVEHSIIIHL